LWCGYSLKRAPYIRVKEMKVRDALKRAILAVENDVPRVLELITIPWENG